MENLREAIEKAIAIETSRRNRPSSIDLAEFIDGLHIFNPDGLLIYYKGFDDVNVDPVLVSGFFSAIQTFTNAIVQKSSQLQEVILAEKKFLFKAIYDGKLIVMMTAKKNLEWGAKKLFEKLSSDLDYALKNTELTIRMLNSFLDIYIDKILPRAIYSK